MRLEEALELGGGAAYGEVKCTYNCLYATEQGGVLFSIPRMETEYDGAFYRLYEDARLRSGQGVEKHDLLPIVYANEEDVQYHDFGGDIGVSIPGYIKIKVQLTEELRIGLEDYIKGIKERRLFKLIMKYKKDEIGKDGKVEHKKGEEVLLTQTYDYVDIAKENAKFAQAYANNTLRYCYWIDATKELNEKYQKLLKIVEENDYVYVLPRNVDWTPADMVITFVDDRNTMVSYEAELKAAEEKVKQAKRLLIASGLASLII